MSTSKTPDNLTSALDALTAELGTGVDRDEVADYLARVDAVVEAARAIRAEHKKAAAVIASKKSRAVKAERVAKAMALLEASEAADAAGEVA
jgi:hypothetical protein